MFVALIATFVVTTLLRQQSLAGSTTDYGFAGMDAETRQKDARATTTDAIESGNGDEAEAVYKQAITAEPDGTKKVAIAIDYSRLLADKKLYDHALEVAKSAEAYSDDQYQISDWLSRLYVRMGRTSDAIAASEKAAGLVDSPTNEGGYTKQYYDKNVSVLKSEANK